MEPPKSKEVAKKRGRGRPKLYSEPDYGAPRLSLRVDPEVMEWIDGQPEKPRPYIEKLVRADKAAALAEQGIHKPSVESSRAELPLTGEAEQAAEA